jgi:anti-sigma factor RsiW
MAMTEHPGPSGIECRQIAELLTDYVEGRLPQATKELIDWHIDGCAPCVAFVNTFRSTLKAVRLLPDPLPVPKELRQRLLAVLRDRSAQSGHDRT